MKNKDLNLKIVWIIVILTLILILSSLYFSGYKLTFTYFDDDISSHIGDFFGGLFGPLLSFLGILYLIKNIKLQQKQINQNKKDSKQILKNYLSDFTETKFQLLEELLDDNPIKKKTIEGKFKNIVLEKDDIVKLSQNFAILKLIGGSNLYLSNVLKYLNEVDIKIQNNTLIKTKTRRKLFNHAFKKLECQTQNIIINSKEIINSLGYRINEAGYQEILTPLQECELIYNKYKTIQ